jgi:hypothetical protein
LAVDEALLSHHRSFEDRRLGIREEFLDLDLASGDTFGVLSRPLGPSRPFGWVVAHSFGTEQTDLQMSEVSLVRRIAAAGFPIVRFHCQGYGDSARLAPPPGLGSQIRDVTEVVRRFPELAGVPAGGVLGARVGAAIGAMVAAREGMRYAVLIQPIQSGARYMNEQIRSRVISEMVKGSEDGGGSTMKHAKESLAAGKVISIKGWALHREVYEEMNGLNLAASLEGFAATTLLVQVSRGSELQGSVGQLAGKLEELGAAVRTEVLADPAAAHFGYEHFQTPDRDSLADSIGELTVSLTDLVGRWVEETCVEGTGGGGYARAGIDAEPDPLPAAPEEVS